MTVQLLAGLVVVPFVEVHAGADCTTRESSSYRKD
jgi:hypothetical protein